MLCEMLNLSMHYKINYWFNNVESRNFFLMISLILLLIFAFKIVNLSIHISRILISGLIV